MWQLIGLYVGRMRPGHANIRLDEIRPHLAASHFAWIGACDDTSPFYYRILSPAILVEFDHQPGIVFDNDTPSRDHIHTLVRTPNGKDYGKDLLRQHYLQWHTQDRASHPHTHTHEAHANSTTGSTSASAADSQQ